MDIRKVAADQTWALRHKVLRPNQTLADCRYPEDQLESAMHFAAFVNGAVVGVASIYNQPEEGNSCPTSWRLRGMASDPSVRGQGYGGALLEVAIDAAAKAGGTLMWANARSNVAGFYLRYGFEVASEPYELPGIGEHVLIRRPLAAG